MNIDRRQVLKGTGGMAVMGLAVAAGVFKPGSAWAQTWNKAAFETKNVADTVKAMGGTAGAVESKDVVISSPDIAENGAVVPFTISSRLPKTESIALLVEKNPNALAASFDIPAGTEAGVTTR
ncbi:MAG TPA: thiosulfate oxidation carrier protein SoxY, partial [Vicinamibacteria bacterium]|nr:thiosulfate oxidation carrier protein SoxY [Vicinamibacteria bacterium]